MAEPIRRVAVREGRVANRDGGSRLRAMGKTQAVNSFKRLALLASPTERAQEAAAAIGDCADWVPLEEAEAAVVLGGDGFMLETMHRMIDAAALVPVYGLNLGT